MANDVFANGREISCKKADGKTICAFPDVCMTPPTSPATPGGVPIPYPNTGMAKDTTNGSRSVKISGQEIIKKNVSYYKTSYGDEAGCATPAKKGIITGTIQGKVYFTSWSMDVKIEDENVVRHLDMTTHNHGSNPNECIPWAHIDTGTFATADECEEDRANEEEACQDFKPKGKKDACQEAGLNEKKPNSDADAISMGFASKADYGNQKAKKANAKNKAAKCVQARRCRLVPFEPKKEYGDVAKCCPSQTGDHIIPKSSFFSDKYGGQPMPGWESYDADKAPVMCLEGGSTNGSHGLRHSFHKSMIHKGMKTKPTEVSFNKEMEFCTESATFLAPQCSPECIQKQLEEGHKDMGDRRRKLRHSPTGSDPSDAEMNSMQQFRKQSR